MTEQLNLLLADTIPCAISIRNRIGKSRDRPFISSISCSTSIMENSRDRDTIAQAISSGVLDRHGCRRGRDHAHRASAAGRKEVPVQISRLLDAHQIIIGHCRELPSVPTSSATMNQRYGC